MIDQLFGEIAIIIVTAGALSLLVYMLRQPLIIAYILTGLIAGPSLLGFAQSPEIFQAMSEIGVAFLLFLVGLHLNWRNIKDVGLVSVMVGIGQVTFTTILGYFIAIWLGFESIPALFIGAGFAFSSTIIIVKLLADKNDLDRFYGRISVGVLIVQDLLAMIVLLVVAAMSDGQGDISQVLAFSTLKVAAVLLALWFISKKILPFVFGFAAKDQEMLFLTALAWCFAVAATLHFIGFGIEIGALLAGISLAGSKFHREIDHKISPLRDFFIVIFFIVLGTHLSIDSVALVWDEALILSAFILIGNPLIVLVLMRIAGYHPRTGFLVGVTMAQVSEFSFILMTAGVASGFIEGTVLTLTTLVGIITILISTYLIKYNEQIYSKIEWIFAWLETKGDHDRRRLAAPADIVLFGYGYLGRSIVASVKKVDDSYLVVDFDPVNVNRLEEKKIPVEYGDAGSEEFLKYLRVYRSKLIISTIGDIAVNSDLIRFIRRRNSRVTIIVTAKNHQHAHLLYELGATYVILPSVLGGELFAEMLKKKSTRKVSWNAEAKKQKKQFGI